MNRAAFRTASLPGAVALLATLAACGGGGGGDGSSNLSGGGGAGTGGGGSGGSGGTAAPFIAGSVFAFPAGGVLPAIVPTGGTATTAAQIADRQGGTPIETATVRVNAVALTYSATSRTYSASLTIAPGEPVSVAVTVGGTSFSAGGRMPTDYPVISEPAAGAAWFTQAPNTIRWTVAAPTATSQFLVGVLDQSGRLVWPATGGFESVPRTQTSVVVPAGVLTAGSRTVVVGIADLLALPGAATGSAFQLIGNRFVPISITGP
jgi:hypothetical protein